MKSVKAILENKTKIVCGCCVYFLIFNDEIVYVGKSINGGFDRIGAHLKYSDKIFDSYFVESCPAEDVEDIETEYIIKFSPKYNKCISSNKKYATAKRIMWLFKFWSEESFLQFIQENKIKSYGGKYYKIDDFLAKGKE